MRYFVGSKRFEEASKAFLFAQQEADRLGRKVEILRGVSSWFATVHPPKQPPMEIAPPREATG